MLPALLEDLWSAFDLEARSFGRGNAGLVAVATLGPEHLSLIVRWLNWAADVLDGHQSLRSAEAIAGSLGDALHAAAEDAALPGCLPASRTATEAAVGRVHKAKAEWNAWVGYNRYAESYR